jgi:hypothetical protein
MTKEEFTDKYNSDSTFKEMVDKELTQEMKNNEKEEIDLDDDSLEKVSGGVDEGHAFKVAEVLYINYRFGTDFRIPEAT